MLLSVIIPTTGRASLAKTVLGVLQQELEDFSVEIIVVNDGKKPLDNEEWHNNTVVTIISTHTKERAVARNTGAAISKGTYLYFLDDDDTLLPGGLLAMAKAAKQTGAAFVYGSTRLVKEDNMHLVDHHIGFDGNIFAHVMTAEWLPLQASLFHSKAFFETGGFDSKVIPTEDKDLCRRIALHHDVVQIPDVVAVCVRGSGDTTSDYSKATEMSVHSRNKILAEKGAFTRMWKSANTAFWKGRMVRGFLTCVYINIKDRRWTKALQHLLLASAATVMSGKYLVQPVFWKAAIKSHSRENVF